MVRIAVLLMVWLVVVPCTAFLLAFFGVLGDVAAWRHTALVFLPLLPVTWLLIRRFPHRRPAMALAGALAGGLVFGLPAWATPGPERLARAERDVAGPSGGILLGRDELGDGWCLEGCPQLLRYYAVPDADRAIRQVETAAKERGWEPATLAQGGADGWCRGDFSLHVSEESGPWAVPSFPVRSAPPGTETVVVAVGANCR